MNNVKKTKFKLYIFIGLHLSWLFFVIYVTGFTSNESILRDNKTGILVLLYIIIVRFVFIKFLTSKEVAKYERSIKKNKSNVISKLSFIDEKKIINNLKKVLEEAGFYIDSNTDENNTKLVAYRRKFSLKSFTFISQVILILEKENVQIKDYNTLYKYGLNYIKEKDKLKAAFGIVTTYMIFPCIISSEFDTKTIKYLTNEPNNDCHLFHFPIGLELSSSNIYFFNGKLGYGMIFNKDYKRIINDYIIKAITGKSLLILDDYKEK